MYLTSNDTAGHLPLCAQWSARSNYIRVQDAEYLDYLDYLAVTLYRCRIYLDYLAVTPLHLGSNFSHCTFRNYGPKLCKRKLYIYKVISQIYMATNFSKFRIEMLCKSCINWTF